MLTPYSIIVEDSGATNLGTLAELNCTQAIVTTTAQGDDVMELTVERNVNGTMPFTPLKRHRLVDANGDTRFVGWLLDPPRRATGVRQEHIYRFSGAWETFLDRTVFRQLSQFAVLPANEKIPLSLVLLNYRCGAVVDEVFVPGGEVSIKEQIEEALEYAKDESGDRFDYDTDALPDVKPPADEQADRTCGEIVRGQLRWCPGVSCYWSYPTDGGVPVLTFVASPETKTITIQDTNVTAFSGTPRYDLLVPKVRLEYLTEISEVATPTLDDPDHMSKVWTLIDTDESTEANGAFGAVEHTVILLKYDDVLQAAPVGLAALLHAPYKTLSTAIAWQCIDDEVDWVDHPAAHKWNVSGAGSGFDAAEGVCQMIARDLMRGTVSYKCGPAAHLGLNDLLALLRVNRKRSSNNQGDGGGGGGDGAGGGTTLEYEEVTGANNGAPATRRVAVDPEEDGWQEI